MQVMNVSMADEKAAIIASIFLLDVLNSGLALDEGGPGPACVQAPLPRYPTSGPDALSVLLIPDPLIQLNDVSSRRDQGVVIGRTRSQRLLRHQFQ